MNNHITSTCIAQRAKLRIIDQRNLRGKFLECCSKVQDMRYAGNFPALKEIQLLGIL